MIQKITFLMQATTAPTNRSAASQHTAGWSESYWLPAVLPLTAPVIDRLATKRAAILPGEASIIGVRGTSYDIAGNRLLKRGSATRKIQRRGVPAYNIDTPQQALGISITSSSSPNAALHSLRCIPDSQISFGEYQPTSAYNTAMGLFCSQLVADAWGFVGRDLSLATQRVISLTGGILTLDGLVGAVIGQDYIRLLRVKQTGGRGITGAFMPTAVNGATFAYTIPALANFEATGGFARKDSLSFFDIGSAVPNRIGTRKVGRPFESYRGRGSKRAVI